MCGCEECRVLDGRKDVKVGKCSDNGEEDDGLYRCVGCMESERTQEGSHYCSEGHKKADEKKNVVET